MDEKIISLVRALQQGNEQAFSDLYNAVKPDLYYFISKTLKDPVLAEDVLQNTFVEIWENIGQLQEPAAFKAWSKKIAYHKCTAHFRKTQDLLIEPNEDGHTILDDIEEDRTEFIPDEALDREELKQTILSMIDELPAEQRSAILLRFYDELSVKEIADIQGVSEGTVKSRLNYGKKAIKNSVETYEKKNGVKLRCAGIVPLLVWLFASEAISASAASTASVAASAAAPVVAEGVKEGAKAAGKFAAKKIIAGITAAAVAAGGITAGVLLSEPTSDVTEPFAREWVGYGQVFYTSESRNRFNMFVDEMDEETIVGVLEVAYLYEPIHVSEFEGSGTEQDGKIVYEISFDTEHTEYQPVEHELPGITAVYDKEAQTLTLDDYYKVELKPIQDTLIIAENTIWSGYGTDNYLGAITPNHRLELSVYKMNGTDLYGNLQIFNAAELEYESNASGRGFTDQDGSIWYEVYLSTPRVVDNIAETTLQAFWLRYDPVTETFAASGFCIYEIQMQKIFSEN